jgi:hypothetical protein
VKRDLVLATLTATVLSGCSPDFRDGTGPIVPVPNVEGAVTRSGSAAPGLGVALRDSSGHDMAKTVTNASGDYGFGNVTSGTWQVKVSGGEPGDYDSVTRDFQLTSPSLTLPVLDVSANGAGATSPADGVTQPVPTPVQPLVFQFNFPSAPSNATAHVQVFDSAGSPVWYSGSLKIGESAWNGLGNQGGYQGRAATPGAYTWRLKFELPDSSEARTTPRGLTLT